MRCYIPNINALCHMVSDNNILMLFHIQAYVKHVIPRAGPFFAPGALFEQIWQRFTMLCFIPNIKALGVMVSDKKIFNVFPILVEVH